MPPSGVRSRVTCVLVAAFNPATKRRRMEISKSRECEFMLRMVGLDARMFELISAPNRAVRPAFGDRNNRLRWSGTGLAYGRPERPWAQAPGEQPFNSTYGGDMNVRDILTPKVEVIQPDASLCEA